MQFRHTYPTLDLDSRSRVAVEQKNINCTWCSQKQEPSKVSQLQLYCQKNYFSSVTTCQWRMKTRSHCSVFVIWQNGNVCNSLPLVVQFLFWLYLSHSRHNVGDVFKSSSMDILWTAIQLGHLVGQTHQRSQRTEQRVQQDWEAALDCNVTLEI